MPAVAYLCENDGLYTMKFITPSLRSIMGYEPSDFIDNKKHFAASTVVPEDLDVVDEFAEVAANSMMAISARYRLVRSNGEIFPALMFVHAVRDPKSKEAVGFCGVLVDITHVPALQGPSQVLTVSPKTATTKSARAKKAR